MVGVQWTHLKDRVDHQDQSGANSCPERTDPLLPDNQLRSIEYRELP